jgi:hypothetical protein
VVEEVAHHDHRQDEAGDEQWDTKYESDGRALTECQTDYETGNEEHQANANAEGKAVSAVECTAWFRNIWSIGVHLKTSWMRWDFLGRR